ncbi:MAG TPA: hypothetical protein GXX75_24625 [Clostridiales bacterium]|nr:hypothetical protein [Clostridiales bacterium]
MLKALAMILLSAAALVPAFLFPRYEAPQPTGNFEVATAQFTYTSDTITDYFTGGRRQVNLGFWYPEGTAGKDTILKNVLHTTVLTQQDDRVELYQIIDSSKIGVFGHSMGAAASVWTGREREDVGAVINIDGPYFSEMVYDANSDEYAATKEQYDTPVLNIYSDQVWVQLQDGTATGVYAGNKISSQICKESYDVYLKGTKHLTLTDLSLTSPFLTYLLDGGGDEVDAKESIELENKIILEFFDDTLKGEGEFSSAGVYEQ